MPFDGTINWEYLINKLKECNYIGPTTMELWYSKIYLEISLYDFYKQGYERGKKLEKIFNR